MPLAEFRETIIKLIQTEFLAERTKRRVDMLEKEGEKDGKQTLSGRGIHSGQRVCTRSNEKHRPTNGDVPKQPIGPDREIVENDGQNGGKIFSTNGDDPQKEII